MKIPATQFKLTLTATPGWDMPAETRLRGALKELLRRFGLRCDEATEVPAEQPTTATQRGPPMT